jgi:hypothetical protein
VVIKIYLESIFYVASNSHKKTWVSESGFRDIRPGSRVVLVKSENISPYLRQSGLNGRVAASPIPRKRKSLDVGLRRNAYVGTRNEGQTSKHEFIAEGQCLDFFAIFFFFFWDLGPELAATPPFTPPKRGGRRNI